MSIVRLKIILTLLLHLELIVIRFPKTWVRVIETSWGNCTLSLTSNCDGKPFKGFNDRFECNFKNRMIFFVHFHAATSFFIVSGITHYHISCLGFFFLNAPLENTSNVMGIWFTFSEILSTWTSDLLVVNFLPSLDSKDW